MDIEFQMPQGANSLIMVAGIGGGGGNAVKHMYSLGVTDVSYIVINTDRQALDRSPIQNRIQLGNGLGAGNNPEKARVDAEQSADQIREALTVSGAKMLFVTACMGGGTGTGASPVVARLAREMGILTVGIVSIPYKGEGPKRVKQAVSGIEELLPCVDSLIVINNEHIAQIYGKLGIREAHAKADDILTMAAKSISEIVISPMDVNVDFADVTTIMKEDTENLNSGKIALMGSAVGEATGEDRALKIAEEAVNSPLLHHNDIRGARKVLLSINWGNDDVQVSYEEALQVMDYIQKRAGLSGGDDFNQADVIWGAGEDSTLGDKIRITIVATGFDTKHIPEIREYFGSVLSPGKKKVETQVPKAPVREVVTIDDVDASQHKKVAPVIDDEFSVVTHERTEPERVVVEVAPTVVVPPTPVVEVAPQGAKEYVSSTVSQFSSSIVHGNDDSSLDMPAYLRRGIHINAPVKNSSATKESLDSDSSKSTRPSDSTLF